MSKSPLVVNLDEVEALKFDWGAIKWLCNSQLQAGSEQTFGIVFIEPGKSNPLHSHPNCEEILYVLSGECDHLLNDEKVHLKAGDAIRIPTGVKHKAISVGWEPLRAVISFSSADRKTIFCQLPHD